MQRLNYHDNSELEKMRCKQHSFEKPARPSNVRGEGCIEPKYEAPKNPNEGQRHKALPIGMVTRYYWLEERKIAIIDAMERYIASGERIPDEWIAELAWVNKEQGIELNKDNSSEEGHRMLTHGQWGNVRKCRDRHAKDIS